MCIKGCNKLLNAQVNEAVHGTKNDPSFLLKDLGTHAWVHWCLIDVNTTGFQICVIEDHIVSFQLMKRQFPEWKDGIFIPGNIWWVFSIILSSALLDLKSEKVCVHLCQSLRSVFSFWLLQCFGGIISWLFFTTLFIFSSKMFWRTVAEIQQKTGMWHMMKRLFDCLTWSMISLADSRPLIFFWSTPLFVHHWILVSLSAGRYSHEESYWQLLVWWWSRGEQKEADFPWWGSLGEHPEKLVMKHQTTSLILKV